MRPCVLRALACSLFATMLTKSFISSVPVSSRCIFVTKRVMAFGCENQKRTDTRRPTRPPRQTSEREADRPWTEKIPKPPRSRRRRRRTLPTHRNASAGTSPSRRRISVSECDNVHSRATTWTRVSMLLQSPGRRTNRVTGERTRQSMEPHPPAH